MGQDIAEQGFTFAISALLISVTLISMAAFAQEWRKGQQSAFTSVLPSEAVRTSERVSADMGEITGAGAEAKKKNQTSAYLRFQGSLPLKKEGSALSQISAYSSSLAASLRSLGYEAVLSANALAGPNATVVRAPDSGRLDTGTDGTYDLAAIYHPLGWKPSSIAISLTCAKSSSFVGEPTVSGTGAPAYSYKLAYSEPGGLQYSREASAPSDSNLSFIVAFADGSRLVANSRFSPSLSQNYTAFYFTKSPSPSLLLPFDGLNASAGGTITDLSPYRRPLALGGGSAISSPSYVPGCRFGSCYYFNGEGNFINGSDLGLTESPVLVQQGDERVQNGGFETPAASPLAPDDGVVDAWANWTLQRANPSQVMFDSTANSSGGLALKVTITDPGCSAGQNYAYQNLNLLGNTQYALTFMSHGDGTSGGNYRVYDPAAGSYLQPGGGWAAANTSLGTGLSGSTYAQVVNLFSLPASSTAGAQLQFLAPGCGLASSTAYYDSVSVKEADGLNGGFESYYYDHVN